MLLLRSSALADTQAIAAQVALLSRPGDIIVLSGEMGAGKTAFAQGFGRALGITEPITSPTYTLVHSYDVPKTGPLGRVTLHHADLYRLDRTAEVADLALDELAEFDGIVLDRVGRRRRRHVRRPPRHPSRTRRDRLDAPDDDGRPATTATGDDARTDRDRRRRPDVGGALGSDHDAVEAYRC